MSWLLFLILTNITWAADPAQSPLLTPHQIENIESSEARLSVVILDQGLRIPVLGLKFREPDGHCTEDKKTRKVLTYLSNPWFRIVHQAEVYRVEFEAPCTSQITAIFNGDTFAAQTLLLWNVSYLGLSKLQSEVGLEFWRTPLIWLWPSDHDSYSNQRISLSYPTNAEIIAHEMGHAVYDLANIGAFRAGEHRLESCTDPTLALTEGWASFFAAWILLDHTSSAPSFHRLTPRFESIPIEKIPSDVCQGTSSEWRVIGFFWDLIDQPLHDDDSLSLPFGEVFKILKDTRKLTINEVLTELKRAPISSKALDDVFSSNFSGH